MKRLLRKIIFYINSSRVLVNGRRLKVPGVFADYFNVMRNNPIEPDLIAFLRSHLKYGDFFVDVGANLGIVGLAASDLVGAKGVVMCFEPNPRMFKMLVEFMNANASYENHLFSQMAVSDRHGRVEFQMDDADGIMMERSSLLHHAASERSAMAYAVGLDSVFRDMNPSVVKIDVEGAEIQVLNGAREMLARNKTVFIVEIHGLYFEDPAAHAARVFEFFETHRYRAYNIRKGVFEEVDDFIKNSGVDNLDPKTGRSMAELCYGNIAFIPGK